MCAVSLEKIQPCSIKSNLFGIQIPDEGEKEKRRRGIEFSSKFVTTDIVLIQNFISLRLTKLTSREAKHSRLMISSDETMQKQ